MGFIVQARQRKKEMQQNLTIGFSLFHMGKPLKLIH